ncbi:Ig-like domain-containing protein [Mycobacterium sp. C31M]
MAGRHRRNREPLAVTVWLGAGVVTLGIGAALTTGTAVAVAETGESGGASASSSAGDSTAGDSSTGTSASGQGDTGKKSAVTDSEESQDSEEAATAPRKKPRLQKSSRTSAEPASLHDQVAAETPRKRAGTVTPAVADESTDAEAPSIRSAAVTTVEVAEPTITPTAKANAAPANPLVTAGQALQDFLRNIQRQYFNTRPQITGYSVPTRNADGTYSGQIYATDADGDPLVYSVRNGAPFGSNLTIEQNGNYTLTPSAYALTREGTGELTFDVVEANAGEHFHGIHRVFEKAIRNALQPIFGQFRLYVDYVPEYYAFDRVVLPSTPWGNTDPTPNLMIAERAAVKMTAAPATTANPLQAFLQNIQRQYFNTRPQITGYSVPTRNADGTYSGRVIAVDADGDPLVYSVSRPSYGSTLTIDQNGNYTLTPSELALSQPTTGWFYIDVVEANADEHYHGLGQIIEKAVRTALQPIFGQFHLFVGYVPESYGSVRQSVDGVGWGNTDPTPASIGVV